MTETTIRQPTACSAARRRKPLGAIALLSLALMLPAQGAHEPLEGGPFKVTKSTIDNGGGQSAGGSFRLNGSIGQPDAANQTAVGGNFSVTGGFWARGNAVPPGNTLFSDSFE